MRGFSYVAVYVLFWVMSAFMVMPWGIRSHDDAQAEQVPGTISSAPVNFRPLRIIARTTALSLVLFAVFFANLHYGWVTAKTVAMIVPVPASLATQTMWH